MRNFTCILLAILFCAAVPETGFTQVRDNEDDARKYTLIFRGEPIEHAIKEFSHLHLSNTYNYTMTSKPKGLPVKGRAFIFLNNLEKTTSKYNPSGCCSAPLKTVALY